MLNQFLQDLTAKGILDASQQRRILALEENRPFSLRTELQVLLYAGVLAIASGLGWTIKDYFSSLGHVAIISVLSTGSLASWIYCFQKGEKISPVEVKSPNLAFDYVLLLGCLLYSLDITYIESHFQLLGRFWQNYLLVSSGLFFFLAYRFDNRLVLSLALSTLAAWFGFTLKEFDFSFSQRYRLYAISYGTLVFSVGAFVHQRSIKKHFLGIYLNFASHFLLAAMVAGVWRYKLFSFYFLGLLSLCSAAVVYAMRSRQFVYMLYAVLYGYVAISIVLIDHVTSSETILLYFVFSSIGVVAALFFLSRSLRKEA